MEKVRNVYPAITVDYKGFHGIGGFSKKKKNAQEMKTGKLLTDLAIYLDGFNKTYKDISNYPFALFIVIDNDDNDPDAFRVQLENVAQEKQVVIDHVFCLAVEEMEAWLLGDEKALFEAYPKAKHAIYQTYLQDSICGTWEKLADIIYPGGKMKLKKDNPTYAGIGKVKNEWATNIGNRMDIDRNVSPSFNFFIHEVVGRASRI